jgi:hypothetical protein
MYIGTGYTAHDVLKTNCYLTPFIFSSLSPIAFPLTLPAFIHLLKEHTYTMLTGFSKKVENKIDAACFAPPPPVDPLKIDAMEKQIAEFYLKKYR